MKKHDAGAQRARKEIIRRHIDSLVDETTCVGALSELTSLARTQGGREDIEYALESHLVLYDALSGENPKARKNAARLLGALADENDTPFLLEALDAEEQLYVRPSIILAIGMTGGDMAKHALESMKVPTGDTKHDKEEAAAIGAARARLLPPPQHKYKGLRAPKRMRLVHPQGFEAELAEELKSLSLPTPFRAISQGVYLNVDDLASLYRARCFREALFVLKENIRIDMNSSPEVMAEAVAREVSVSLATLLSVAHEGNPPFAYRIECRLKTSRGDFVRALANKLAGGGYLLNNPFHYEAQLIIEDGLDGVSAYCKLHTFKDERFSYRKNALSASIHPATAAALARFSLEYTSSNPRILDPCCGTGTLLIERGKLTPRADLTGVDITEKAVRMAKENAKAANSSARFLQKDARNFIVDTPYDLILSNLPFGNRVGTHDDNKDLYMTLLSNMEHWLTQGGIAILYTMEYALLTKCARLNKHLQLLDTRRTEAGGLLPYVAVLKRK